MAKLIKPQGPFWHFTQFIFYNINFRFVNFIFFKKKLLVKLNLSNLLFFNDKFGSPDRSLEYYRATSGTTRSYPSPLGIMAIHQFRRKPNKCGKKLRLWKSNPGPIGSKTLSTPKCH
ncbi:hypothetical protein Hanom_Chr08g00753601 [Helianthus anomalus]